MIICSTSILINVKVFLEQQTAADKVTQLAVCELLHGIAQNCMDSQDDCTSI